MIDLMVRGRTLHLTHFLYDMDDTLVRTWNNWLGAIQTYMQQQTLPFDPDGATQYLGKNCKDICQQIDSRFHQVQTSSIDLNQHVDILRNYLLDQVRQKPPEEVNGATVFLRSMADHVSQQVVSGSPQAVIAQILQQKNWLAFLQGFRSSETVAHGKPDPLIYNSVVADLQVSKDQCLIFEDSPAGVEAARRANIHCICINPRIPVEASESLIGTFTDFTALMDAHLIHLPYGNPF